mmetsp:Transcript_34108/g.72576  ORF Transcript_34108/g.72576 Transcript_34108/m.72576 type:complete len:381 (-) Transcript_34108:600-1742(-)
MVAEEHELEAQPISAAALAIVGPHGVVAGVNVVEKEEGIAGLQQRIPAFLVLELRFEHSLHGGKLVPEAAVSVILVPGEFRLQDQRLLAGGTLELIGNEPEVRSLEGRQRVLEALRLSRIAGRLQLNLCMTQLIGIPKDAGAANPVTGVLHLVAHGRVGKGDDADFRFRLARVLEGEHRRPRLHRTHGEGELLSWHRWCRLRLRLRLRLRCRPRRGRGGRGQGFLLLGWGFRDLDSFDLQLQVGILVAARFHKRQLAVEAVRQQVLAGELRPTEEIVRGPQGLGILVVNFKAELIAPLVVDHMDVVPNRIDIVRDHVGLELLLGLALDCADAVGVRAAHPICIAQAGCRYDGDLQRLRPGHPLALLLPELLLCNVGLRVR